MAWDLIQLSDPKDDPCGQVVALVREDERTVGFVVAPPEIARLMGAAPRLAELLAHLADATVVVVSKGGLENAKKAAYAFLQELGVWDSALEGAREARAAGSALSQNAAEGA